MNERLESLRQQAYELNPSAQHNREDAAPCVACGHEASDHDGETHECIGGFDPKVYRCPCTGYLDPHEDPFEDEAPEPDYYADRY